MKNNTAFVLIHGLLMLVFGALASGLTGIWIAASLLGGELHSSHTTLMVMFWFGFIVMYVVARGDVMYGKQVKWYRHGAGDPVPH